MLRWTQFSRKISSTVKSECSLQNRKEKHLENRARDVSSEFIFPIDSHPSSTEIIIFSSLSKFKHGPRDRLRLLLPNTKFRGSHQRVYFGENLFMSVSTWMSIILKIYNQFVRNVCRKFDRKMIDGMTLMEYNIQWSEKLMFETTERVHFHNWLWLNELICLISTKERNCRALFMDYGNDKKIINAICCANKERNWETEPSERSFELDTNFLMFIEKQHKKHKSESTYHSACEHRCLQYQTTFLLERIE